MTMFSSEDLEACWERVLEAIRVEFEVAHAQPYREREESERGLDAGFYA